MITRAAFLYLEPKDDQPRFAQCETCNKFSGSRCMDPLGAAVTKDASCGFYVPGQYSGIKPGKAVSPDDAGFYVGDVRCENCVYGGRYCELYDTLNKKLPEQFALEIAIKPQGCCNAFTPRKNRDAA